MNHTAVHDFSDECVYIVKCSRGHDNTVLMHEHKYELLFDVACQAMLDRYFREAVSSFAASLERFYEFAIRVLIFDATKSPELFKSLWKKMSNQSERQLGGFITLWSARFGSEPTILTEKQAKFRNSVVHKGSFPKSEEAMSFGSTALEIIRTHEKELRKNLAASVNSVESDYFREQRPADFQGIECTSSTTLIPGQRTSDDVPSHDLLERHLISLENLRRARAANYDG